MKINILITIVTTLAITFIGCEQLQTKDENKSNEQQLDPSIVNNPATANSDNNKNQKMQPILEFETTRHHFGVIQAGEKVSYSFNFKNTGNASLVISSSKASCGCTVPSYTKEPVQPGEDGSIEVTFDSSGKSGMESKNITIIANTIPNSTVLTISAEIISTDKK